MFFVCSSLLTGQQPSPTSTTLSCSSWYLHFLARKSARHAHALLRPPAAGVFIIGYHPARRPLRWACQRLGRSLCQDWGPCLGRSLYQYWGSTSWSLAIPILGVNVWAAHYTKIGGPCLGRSLYQYWGFTSGSLVIPILGVNVWAAHYTKIGGQRLGRSLYQYWGSTYGRTTATSPLCGSHGERECNGVWFTRLTCFSGSRVSTPSGIAGQGSVIGEVITRGGDGHRRRQNTDSEQPPPPRYPCTMPTVGTCHWPQHPPPPTTTT